MRVGSNVIVALGMTFIWYLWRQPESIMLTLTARHGKDKVRVFRVVRSGDWHDVVEYNVTVLLEGDAAVDARHGFSLPKLSWR